MPPPPGVGGAIKKEVGQEVESSKTLIYEHVIVMLDGDGQSREQEQVLRTSPVLLQHSAAVSCHIIN